MERSHDTLLVNVILRVGDSRRLESLTITDNKKKYKDRVKKN